MPKIDANYVVMVVFRPISQVSCDLISLLNFIEMGFCRGFPDVPSIPTANFKYYTPPIFLWLISMPETNQVNGEESMYEMAKRVVAECLVDAAKLLKDAGLSYDTTAVVMLALKLADAKGSEELLENL